MAAAQPPEGLPEIAVRVTAEEVAGEGDGVVASEGLEVEPLQQTILPERPNPFGQGARPPGR